MGFMPGDTSSDSLCVRSFPIATFTITWRPIAVWTTWSASPATVIWRWSLSTCHFLCELCQFGLVKLSVTVRIKSHRIFDKAFRVWRSLGTTRWGAIASSWSIDSSRRPIGRTAVSRTTFRSSAAWRTVWSATFWAWRTSFIVSEFSVAVLIECQQRRGGLFQFVSRNLPICVLVQRSVERVGHWGATFPTRSTISRPPRRRTIRSISARRLGHNGHCDAHTKQGQNSTG